MVSDAELQKQIDCYHKNGYAIFENFLSEDEVNEIRQETVKMVREKSSILNPEGKVTKHEVWGNPDTNPYYGASDDGKVRLFYEQYAVDKENLKLKIKPEEALCKMGFALHRDSPYFMNFVRSKKINDMLRALDYKDPTLIQTMVNFKNAGVGGEFIPHQDASYLSTTDNNYLVGFWFALDDATPENGCLDIIPGSHKWALNRRYVRPEGGKDEEGNLIHWTGPMAIYDEKMYVKVPCKRGALVLIHGLLLHKSDPNRTDKSRWAFVFHTFDRARCQYLDGWLSAKCPAFVPVYAN